MGHQFHVSLSTPVSALTGALDRFADLGVTQAVTELDVGIGTPATAANLVEQGYWFRDAFRGFRERADGLFSVTVWGLTDDRSWRDDGGPLLFDGDRQAKPAYHGAVDGDIPARLKSAGVFAGDVPLDDDATSSPAWDRLPRHAITADGSGEAVADFQLRWAADHLTAQVRVTDDDVEDADAVTFDVEGATTTVGRDGTVTGPDGAAAVVEPTDDGYVVVAHLPLEGAAQGDVVGLDVQVADGATTSGWNTPGSLGTLPLLEDLALRGVRILLPVLGTGLERDWAPFAGADDLLERAPGRPPEPGTEHLGAEALAEADVIIAPALAVDTTGARLGQGGGWYDRALGHKRPDAKVVALVFPEEVYDAADRPLPREPHDKTVDAVATPLGWRRLP